MVSLRLAEEILSMCVPTTMTGELGARPCMGGEGRWRGGARRKGQG